MFKLAVVFCSLALTTVLASPAIVEPSVKAILRERGTADVLVVLEKTTEVLKQLNTRSYESREERLRTVAASLKYHAARTQKAVLSFLKTKKDIEVRSFWLSNQILVKNADSALVSTLAALPGVLAVNEDKRIPLDDPIDFKEASSKNPTIFEEWGVGIISAPGAWAEGTTGTGVVVATIDTGVRYTHEALASNYRSEYGWHDPYTGSSNPIDENGHGTHTTGTIAGQNGIGVAPGAKWIACRGCDTSSCATSALLECGDWIACPNSGNCDMAPHVVSNSWGGGQGQTYYAGVVSGWHAAGIIPVFSAGNSGSACGTANSPGDLPDVISVGSTTINDELSSFSSKGPSVNNILKPDLSAPGSNVRSSYNSANNAYVELSGTSMACPHVSGTVALLLSVKSDLTYEEVKSILFDGCSQDLVQTGQNCGGISDSVYPNHSFGYGRINALNSLHGMKKLLKN